MARGGKEVTETPGIAPGARRGFASGTRALAGLKTIQFINAEDASKRGIERHDGKVTQVLNYKLVTDTVPHYVLVYLTSDELVTDCDVVDR